MMIGNHITRSLENQSFHCLSELLPGLSMLRTLDKRSNLNAALPRLDCVVSYGDALRKDIVFYVENRNRSHPFGHYSFLIVETTVFIHAETAELSFIATPTPFSGLRSENRKISVAQQSFLSWASMLLQEGYELREVDDLQPLFTHPSLHSANQCARSSEKSTTQLEKDASARTVLPNSARLV